MTPAFLRQWRRWREMTQPEAAAWYGVNVRTWRRWERGESPLPTPLVNRVHGETIEKYLLGKGYHKTHDGSLTRSAP